MVKHVHALVFVRDDSPCVISCPSDPIDQEGNSQGANDNCDNHHDPDSFNHCEMTRTM